MCEGQKVLGNGPNSHSAGVQHNYPCDADMEDIEWKWFEYWEYVEDGRSFGCDTRRDPPCRFDDDGSTMPAPDWWPPVKIRE